MEQWDVIIIGAGIAGMSAAAEYHGRLPDHRILIVDAEDAVPYKRTKLSKILADETSLDEISLDLPDLGPNVHLVLGYHVSGVDHGNHVLALDNGERHGFRFLLLACGAAPVLPPLLAEHGEAVHVFRTAHDLVRIRKELQGTKRWAVIGAGILGVEIADQLVRAGKHCLLVSRAVQVMPHELDPGAAELFQASIRKAGVDLRLGTELESLRRRKDGRWVLAFPGGRQELYHGVICCTGSAPHVELARSTGCAVRSGIVVNEHMETTLSDVWAAGDCAETEDAGPCHLWHESESQGRVAGARMAAAAGATVAEDLPAVKGPFRTKCEVFGTWAWSMGYRQDLGLEQITYDVPGAYRTLWLKEGTIHAAVVVGDKDRNKVYEDAVRSRWSPAALEEGLASFSAGTKS